MKILIFLVRNFGEITNDTIANCECIFEIPKTKKEEMRGRQCNGTEDKKIRIRFLLYLNLSTQRKSKRMKIKYDRLRGK